MTHLFFCTSPACSGRCKNISTQQALPLSHCGISVHLFSTFPLPTSISRGETKMSLQPESHLCTPVIYGRCLLCSQHSGMDCNPPAGLSGQGKASLNQGMKTWASDFGNAHFSPHCWPKSSRACRCLRQKQPWTELTTAIVKSIFISFTPASVGAAFP